MAELYLTERERQDAFLKVWNSRFPGIAINYSERGSSSSTGRCVKTDGEASVMVGSSGIVYVLLEVKNEMDRGDPLFQLLRYVQVRQRSVCFTHRTNTLVCCMVHLAASSC
jgi:hypothetical protein